MIIFKSYTTVVLFFIVLIGFGIRVFNISSIPTGFFCDEASTGYNAYLISQTGHDEYDRFLPVFFQSFGNFRPGVPFYFTTPFVAILGLSEFSTRFPSVIIGTLSILVLYFLTQVLFSSKLISLFSSLFLAISPWHIHFSRYGAENIYLPFFLMLGSLLFLYSLQKKNKNYLFLSAVIFGLGIYTYFQAYYLVPLFVLTLISIYAKQLVKMRKEFFIFLMIFTIFSFPLLRGLKTGETLGRFNQVVTANNKKDFQTITKGFFNTYREHFTLEFLFNKGDIDFSNHFITRFSIRGLGELYWFQLPLILIGIMGLFRYRKPLFFLLFWILVYPLGSSLAPFADGGGPFATRSIIGVIPFQILAALGVYVLHNFHKHAFYKIPLLVAVSLVSLYFFLSFIRLYIYDYPLYSSDFWGWQYGPKDIISYFTDHQKEYDELYMQGEFNAPNIFFSFYAPNNCYTCRLGTFEMYNPEKKQLFAITPAYKIANNQLPFTIKKTLYYPNGKEAFYIGVVQK